MSFPTAPTLISAKTTRVGNVGVGVQTLLSITIPPNVLKEDGDMIRLTAYSVLAANVNNKLSQLFFGIQSVAGRGPAADNGGSHTMQAWITRLSQTDQQSIGITLNQSTGTVIALNRDTMANDCATPIEIRLAAEGVANNDLVSRLLKVEYLPVGSTFGL